MKRQLSFALMILLVIVELSMVSTFIGPDVRRFVEANPELFEFPKFESPFQGAVFIDEENAIPAEELGFSIEIVVEDWTPPTTTADEVSLAEAQIDQAVAEMGISLGEYQEKLRFALEINPNELEQDELGIATYMLHQTAVAIAGDVCYRNDHAEPYPWQFAFVIYEGYCDQLFGPFEDRILQAIE